tara:strand:- start:394 stop:582 length:189 start_codon:yes stop_codon:yes gene_type:complete
MLRLEDKELRTLIESLILSKNLWCSWIESNNYPEGFDEVTSHKKIEEMDNVLKKLASKFPDK